MAKNVRMLRIDESLSGSPATPTDWRQRVPTVSELTRRLRGHIEGAFFDVFVRGEISGFRRPSSGHGYFVLKDERTQLRAVMFRPFLSRLRFTVEDGMEVILHGKLSVYEARGEYQLVCDAIEPMGIGALQLAFEQLKKKLEAEGLFDAAAKKPLPLLPSRIGVVTSPTGAAIRDILHVLERRYADREILLFPAMVQGERAASEIAEAIGRACRWNTQHPGRALDVLIVGRGGGSIEDLWPFNEEIVARAIFACEIPVISAVGHEIDFTISDFVADKRAPTPSAAAEIVVPLRSELIERVRARRAQMHGAVQRNLEQAKLHVGHLERRLPTPRDRVAHCKKHLEHLHARLHAGIRARVNGARSEWTRAARLLDSLSPLRVLGRGFAIATRPSGAIVRSVTEVRPKERLTVRVADGRLGVEVLSSLPESG